MIESRKQTPKKHGTNGSSVYSSHQTNSTYSSDKSKKIVNNLKSIQEERKGVQDPNPYTTFARERSKNGDIKKNSFNILIEEGEKVNSKMVEQVLKNGEHLLDDIKRLEEGQAGLAELSFSAEYDYGDQDRLKRSLVESKLTKTLKSHSSNHYKAKQNIPKNSKIYHPNNQQSGFVVESVGSSSQQMSTFQSPAAIFKLPDIGKTIGESPDQKDYLIFADDLEYGNTRLSQQSESQKVFRSSGSNFEIRPTRVVINQNNGKNLKVYDC